MTCKFSIDMKRISELEVLLVQPVFENTLSSSHPSPVQTIPCSFCLPTSHRAYGLAASPALHYPPWSHRGPSFRWEQWKKCQTFPPPSFRLWPWRFAASWGGCGDLLLYGQMCLRCFSSDTSECLLYFLLLGLSSPVPQKQACSLGNTNFLLKPWAVTGRRHHQFNLWTLVNKGTLLWLQRPLGFCNNYRSLHG